MKRLNEVSKGGLQKGLRPLIRDLTAGRFPGKGFLRMFGFVRGVLSLGLL